MSVSRVTLDLVGKKVRIPANLIAFAELAKKENGFVAVIKKKPIELAYGMCGARHWYKIYLVTMPRGGIFIPLLKEPRKEYRQWAGEVPVIAERRLPYGRLYVYIYDNEPCLAREGFLTFEVVSESEMKISKNQRDYDYTLLVVEHSCHSRAHCAELEVVGARVIAEEFTATRLDSKTSKVIIVPRGGKFAVVKNTCPYRGDDEYELSVCDESGRCEKHGLYPSMSDAKSAANELLSASTTSEEEII